jgi:hypothetical protein
MGKATKKMSAGWMIPISNTAPPTNVAPINASANFGIPQNMQQSQSQSQAQIGGVDPLSAMIMTINTNPYLIGMFMILMNLGGRFLSLELTKKQEALFQSPWIRPLIFFTVVFMATRNVVVAFWITLLLFFVIWVVANENSPFCMIPDWCGDATKEKANYLKNVKRMFSA